MSSRTRRAAAAMRKQQKYRIVDDDSEEDEDVVVVVVDGDEVSASGGGTEDSSNKFGGILASLSNKPPHKKNTIGSTQKRGSQAPIGTPNRREPGPKQSASPSLPSSIVVDKRSLKKMSPLPVQGIKWRKRSSGIPEAGGVEEGSTVDHRFQSKSKRPDLKPKNMESKRKDNGTIVLSESSSSCSHESLSENHTLTVDEDDVTSNESTESGDASESSEESGESEDNEDSNSDSVIDNIEENDEDLAKVDDDESEKHDVSSSEEEFEFNDDDEFDPEDDTDGDCSEDNLSDFIVEDTPPKKKPSRRIESKSSSTKPNLNASAGRIEFNKKEQQNNDSTSVGDSRLSKGSVQTFSSTTIGKGKSSMVDTPISKETQDASDGSSPEYSQEVSEIQCSPDDGQNDYFLQSPTTLSRGEDTEAEETPAKFTVTRKTLHFESPEPQMAMIVDDDDDSLDDGLVVTIVDTEDASKSMDATKPKGDVVEMKKTNSEKVSMEQINASSTVTGSKTTGQMETEEIKSLDPTPKCNGKSHAEVSDQSKTNSADKMKELSTSEPMEPLTNRGATSYYRQEGVVKKGKWTLGVQIGKGSFGNVYVGMNTFSGVLMAVKRFRMKNAILKDIRTEVELLRSLDHKNIVRYYGAQMDKENLHVFQEWVPGGSVETLLSRFGSFSMEVIQSYLSQTLSGLSYLHKNDVMHRDIKGSNILVNDEGIVKLADFGASKKLANLEDNLMMSMTVRGTPYFMAPEVFEEKYSAKADIWGVGCVAYQMTTGRPPWKDRGFANPISLFNYIKKTKGAPTMIHPSLNLFSTRQMTLWNQLEELVRKCFDHDPSVRPTASDLQQDPFFLSVHDIEDENDESYRELFSPGQDMMGVSDGETASRANHSSLPSPSVSASLTTPDRKLSRSKSVVQWKSSFLSPPRPRKTPHKQSPSPSRRTPQKTPLRPTRDSLSPSPDTSEWPQWARVELKKKIGPLTSPNPEVESLSCTNLSQMMDSLALSEDSKGDTVGSRPRRVRKSLMTKSAASNLVGLNFLESSSDTYEI